MDGGQNDISLMVDSMKSRAQRRKDRTALLPFEQTLEYARQLVDKAVKTRRQNAEKAETEAEPPATPDAPASSPSPV